MNVKKEVESDLDVSLKCKRSTITHSQYIHIASGAARNSPLKWKYGCVIVKRGRVISIGFNHYGLSPFSGIHATHAEIDALNKCRNKKLLNNASMYIVRINNKSGGPRGTNTILSGKPCSECAVKINKMIKQYGLGRVYYTTDTKNCLLG